MENVLISLGFQGDTRLTAPECQRGQSEAFCSPKGNCACSLLIAEFLWDLACRHLHGSAASVILSVAILKAFN